MTRPIFEYKYLPFLAIIFPITYIAPDVLVYKLVHLGPIETTGAVYIFILSFFLGDVITEVYGYKIARHIIWCSVIADIIFSFFVTLIIHLPSPAGWDHQPDFQYVLGSSFRATLSDIAIPIGMLTNSYLLSKFKLALNGRLFWLRSLFSSIAGELMLSFITYPVIFIGVFPLSQVMHLFITGYLLKVSYSIIVSIPTALLVKLIKKKENQDAFDHGVNFNPFRLSIND